MKRIGLTTLVTALVIALLCAGYAHYRLGQAQPGALLVGFIYENDDSTTYTYNFSQAQAALEKAFGDRVKTLSKSNVLETETAGPLRELADKGCRLIFTNSYSDQVRLVASEYPDVQFCQVSCFDPTGMALPGNYHTFNGETYQGRYVSGVAAGLKLRAMIDRGEIAADKALVGFVGAKPTADVISSYTAFLLGVRSAAPEATLRVRYTGAWTSYDREKAAAERLIDEGCLVISQHAHTIGAAVACAEAEQRVYHVGFYRDMMDVAPTASLISARVNWTPYVTGAVEAVMNGEPIEKRVKGTKHGRDVCGGFEDGWIEMLELNSNFAEPGMQEALDRTVEALRKGRLSVFKGDYIGVNLANASDSVNLKDGFTENAQSSFPSFHYILDGVVAIGE